jgi:iron complex outermembrane receptor protein
MVNVTVTGSERLFGTVLLGICLWLGLVPQGANAQNAAPSAAPRTAASGTATASAAPDSTHELAPLVVSGSWVQTAAPDQVRLDEAALTTRGSWSVAEIGPLLPATQLIVNSRGENQFMVRGAPERHLRLFLDGIPLVLPWDERADLSLLPTHAIGSVHATRGVSSALDDPNTLAGTVRLAPRQRLHDGRTWRLGFQMGDSRLAEGRLLFENKQGTWDVLAALAHRRRDAFLVPADYAPPSNQVDGRERTNSDFEQTALLLRLERSLGRDGRLSFLCQGSDGAKGIPPETHLGSDARFWRYPLQRRALFGLGLDLPLTGDGGWKLDANASLDLFQQEIRKYDDVSYTGPPLAPGVPYEKGQSQTGYARVRLTQWLPAGLRWSLQGVGRYTRHRESLEVAGPELTYAQSLYGLVGELATEFNSGWELRCGGGYELAATPETGDKPAKDSSAAPVVHVYVARELGQQFQLHVTASHRRRFPSLRELYSGSLGRFVPNPDLRPERQYLFEMGGVLHNGSYELGVTAFTSYLDAAIEKVVLPGSPAQFQRRNVGQLRSRGVECVAGLRPSRSFELALHTTVLQARRREEGCYCGRAEDRPDYLASLAVTLRPVSSLSLRGECEAIGPRYSADLTNTDTGLSRLPAQVQYHLRAGLWRGGLLNTGVDGEIFLRLHNVLDQQVDSQVGLIQPGRMILVGIDLGHER